MDRFKIITKNEMGELPKTSGVYAFFAKNLKFKIRNLKLECIYIGKAINIQSRVKNHFQQPSYKDDLFIDRVDKIIYFETDSEIEALVLEASLIKKYQPKFNVVWRDDKNYFYVAIVPMTNPSRIHDKVGTKNEQKIPYVFITHQPKSISNLKFQISNSQYVGPFVEGTALKKTLRFLRRVFPYYSTKRHPKNKCTYCHLGLCPGPTPDLVEYKKNINKLILILEGKRNAVLNSLKKEMQKLSKDNMFEEAGKIRDRISNLQQVMAHTGVIEADKRQNQLNGQGNDEWPKTQKILQGLTGLNKGITRIECYDVSNIQGKFATSSMVVFINGQADKNYYRKFKIKMKNEPNDIAMLKETLQRRLAHPEWKYPEIILIDGGIAQFNVAVNTKNQANSPEAKEIKVLSIAKRNNDLYIEGYPGKSILLKTLPREIYNLILQLDDEAHRFAIAYHKKLRKNNLLLK